ncbi:two component transcriptional regulator, winged helix family [Paenibacillus curdlanolyticus YK9]|uniref:Two component transcriptional regulator, winged helix family n=1 Tax=Paenibacillus curdlanolyticus YK9 TaxID=717606 RepID=E0IE17_9BACL|nr:response regulator transcription factor [Paenibacillus curdlanolyticus]EFM09371.1 two component transcriptional regulator, winged helix family [Paenibacillus curdlanolyticus YK9]
MTRTILIVDDDRQIAELVDIYLRNEGYSTAIAGDGEEALRMFEAQPFDLIVLDVMMPRMDGLELCRRLRRDKSAETVPILMVSAKAEDMDKIMGLMTGADDYMTKPFNPLELTARVKSLLRRSYQYSKPAKSEDDGSLFIGGLKMDRTTHKVEADGRLLHLTSTEFGILYLLASQPGRVFSAEEIFQHVWREKYFESNNTVMVHISKLRDKLEQETGDKLIATVWGVGYKIDA